jgi:tetratricopeptide (TPR) repeat protein
LLEIAELRPHGCDLARVWLNAGSIYLVFNHLDEAVTAYRHCLHIEPDDWKARFNLGLALARQRVLAIARTELERARECTACPEHVHERVRELVAAIDTIQSRRTEQAYKATNDARAFTWRYLETVRLLVKSRERARRVNDQPPESLSLPPPNAPLLFDLATGWNGPIACLLHDLHVNASLHGVALDQEYMRLDEAATGFVSLPALETLYRRLCGVDLPRTAMAALGSMFLDE